MANEPVLVDTSCWIEYFNRPGTQGATVVEDAVREDQAALTGIVLAELSQRARNEAELSRLRAALGAVRWVAATREVHERAGGIGFELRRRGVTVPITDCVIAAAAESIGGFILTLDSHFEEISEVSTLTVMSG
ncbi:MAG: PIN domain-containing protein [Rubrobacteraceae bacterium]